MLKIAIVGRPNVGKSALFNRICKERKSIVDEAEGITRDRIYAQADCFGIPFEVIDTGGIHQNSKSDFNDEIKRQALIAIEEADRLIMVVDAQVGSTDLDQEVAHILLRSKKPLCLAVNKIDIPSQQALLHDFYNLGIEKMIPLSAAHGYHIAELLETILEGYHPENAQDEGNKSIHVAIMGRPNVGKSTLLNFFLNDERSIVSPIAGTTRDSIDAQVSYQENLYTFIDTAGIRRKKSEHEVVDKFAFIRTKEALERADVCLLMLDAQEGLSLQDKKIAKLIEKSGKACILLFNKWDLIKGIRMEHCLEQVKREAQFLSYCPMLFISALTSRNLFKVFDSIQHVHKESQKRISTSQLNNFVERQLQLTPPPMIQGKRLRVYYTTQVETHPPTFIMFVNRASLLAPSYKRFIINQFRKHFCYDGVPFKVFLKGKKQDMQGSNQRSNELSLKK